MTNHIPISECIAQNKQLASAVYEQYPPFYIVGDSGPAPGAPDLPGVFFLVNEDDSKPSYVGLTPSMHMTQVGFYGYMKSASVCPFDSRFWLKGKKYKFPKKREFGHHDPDKDWLYEDSGQSPIQSWLLLGPVVQVDFVHILDLQQAFECHKYLVRSLNTHYMYGGCNQTAGGIINNGGSIIGGDQ